MSRRRSSAPSDPIAALVDREMEAGLVGFLLRYPSAWSALDHAGITADLFFDQRHRHIVSAAALATEEGIGIDVPTVARILVDRGQIEDVGVAYLSQLPDGVPRFTEENIAQRGRRLRMFARARLAYYGGQQLARAALVEPEAVDTAVSQLADTIGAAAATETAEVLVDDDMLCESRAVSYAVQEVLPTGALVLCSGESEAGKSFLAVGLAGSLATGRSFLGWRVREPGQVVYLAGEGQAGIGVRLRAWKLFHGIAPSTRIGVSTWLEPFALTDAAARRRFLSAIRHTSPRAVIVDTYNVFSGVDDENSAGETGRFLRAVRALQRDLDGAAIIIVHHRNAAGDKARGSTALHAGVDVAWKLERTDDLRTFASEKAKDGAGFESLSVTLRAVDGVPSCVLVPTHTLDVQDVPALSGPQRQALTALVSSFGDDGVTATDWMAAARLSRPTFFRAIKVLTDRALVTKDARDRYRPSVSGREVAA